MTKTAEKIKVMQAFEEWKKRGFNQPALIEKKRLDSDLESWEDVAYEPIWDWQVFEYRIKPPDHKPLECWANVYDKVIGGAYATLKEAESFLLKGGETIHMREVTSSAGYCEDYLNPKSYDHNSAEPRVTFERDDALNELRQIKELLQVIADKLGAEWRG